jgi:hypothetical protein
VTLPPAIHKPSIDGFAPQLGPAHAAEGWQVDAIPREGLGSVVPAERGLAGDRIPNFGHLRI